MFRFLYRIVSLDVVVETDGDIVFRDRSCDPAVGESIPGPSPCTSGTSRHRKSYQDRLSVSLCPFEPRIKAVPSKGRLPPFERTFIATKTEESCTVIAAVFKNLHAPSSVRMYSGLLPEAIGDTHAPPVTYIAHSDKIIKHE
jgi:hypothetical protein